MVGKLNLLCALTALVGTCASSMSGIEQRVRRTTINPRGLAKREDTKPSLLYPAYNLSVPVDHFHNDSLYEPHSSESFNLRYWFDATYYKPGGPVIVLQSGETSGVGRLGFLQKGLLHQLAVATGGIGVVLEHRYYGTKSLRFLTTDQALADEAYFAKNVVFEGLEQYNLTAPHTAYFGYGGSYAGAFVAFLRKLYPDVFWGTISSSGVTEAIWDYWAYYEPIRVYGEPTCISYAQKIINMVDNLLIKVNTTETTTELKTAFGLPNVTYDDDFAATLSWTTVGTWQGRNWDPELNDPSFDEFCGNITSGVVEYSETTELVGTVQDLLKKGGYESEVSTLTTPLLNWIGWMGNTTISNCEGSQDRCYGSHNSTYYAQDSLDDDWRSWPYQYCTQWGYLQTGSGVPADQLPLISRMVDLEFSTIVCREAFNISQPANVTAINKYGGFNISYPRFAIVDGEQDPWRPACPSASPFNSTAVNRTSTVSEPFMLIEGGVHHWDENGLFPNQTVDVPPNFLPPPPRIEKAQIITELPQLIYRDLLIVPFASISRITKSLNPP
ncbi:putative serine protease K12H4.7 [Glarea lozoyensis 74030]|uniref:Putative serine protease K12H4.7 n=1 Tax=Glarea lozoyensis (strain ATCC 74030 / MF5533) TaxID=1104152 RepID=H0EHE5_GLAL7|nr:putative serine protease K12H4.7 [Glarea lozoyensis 74030]